VARASLADFSAAPRARIEVSNRLCGVLDLYWCSPESDHVWYKSRKLKKMICLLRACCAHCPHRGKPINLKSPCFGPEFVLALAGIRRLVVQIKAVEKEDLLRI